MEAVMDPGKVRAFLDPGSCDGSGSGSGSGYGSGFGDGDGSGSGFGDGDGSGSGYGFGSGSGFGDGDGSGSGYGFGDGSGYGYGFGDGDGSGSGSGFGDGSGSGSGFGDGSDVAEVNGQEVYDIDGVATLLYTIHGNVAKGAILRDNLTSELCYIAKGGGKFAHGETLRKAMEALTDKLMEDMPEEERIAAFVKAHPEYRKPYPNRDFYDWHHRLTGSCEMGRNAFAGDKGIDLDGESTVEEFVRLTRNAYGGSVIRKLPGAYGEEEP